MKRLALTMWAALISAAAGCHHTPSRGDYDRSCSSVSDCAAVYIGPLGCCDEACPNAAVRTTAADQVQKDVEAARECKGFPPPCVPPTPGQCPDGRVLCEQGTCTLETGSQDASAPACALTDGGTCVPLTAATSCSPLVGAPYDRANGCRSATVQTLACCASKAGDVCLQADAINCVMLTSGGTMAWFTTGSWSAPGFAFCDDETRLMVGSAPTCGR